MGRTAAVLWRQPRLGPGSLGGHWAWVRYC
jgi:hypothetical protein